MRRHVPDDKRVHLGIIGLGDRSRQIFEAAGALPEAKITGCYSTACARKEQRCITQLSGDTFYFNFAVV
jgi:hypothetical protein